MGESVRIVRLAGISISIHWSTLLLGALVLVSVSTGTFPTIAPDAGSFERWSLGLVATAFFFGSLLAHEFAHALVARRQGAHVEGITLFLLGGISTITQDSTTPRGEWRRAIVGPLTSIALGVFFGLITIGLAAANAGLVATLVPGWLAGINIMLGLFNLIPAFPLDGGRMLRAHLWKASGDATMAMVRAARIGKWFGYAVVGIGFLEFWAYTSAGGLWLMLIGGFLVMADNAEVHEVLVRGTLQGVRVGQIMTSHPRTAPDWISVEALLDDYVIKNRHGSLPVHDVTGMVTGLITLKNVIATPAELRPRLRVSEIATPLASAVQCSPSEPILELRERLQQSDDQRALVMEGSRLVGIVAPSDIAFAEAVGTASPVNHSH